MSLGIVRSSNNMLRLGARIPSGRYMYMPRLFPSGHFLCGSGLGGSSHDAPGRLELSLSYGTDPASDGSTAAAGRSMDAIIVG
jgi:hypothetical protein